MNTKMPFLENILIFINNEFTYIINNNASRIKIKMKLQFSDVVSDWDNKYFFLQIITKFAFINNSKGV